MKNALTALFVLALLAAACGDDDSVEVELSDGGTVTLMTHDSFVVSDAVLRGVHRRDGDFRGAAAEW